MLEDTLSSKVTAFPLQDGSIVSEHIIHQPETLKLEVAQTQRPFEDTEEGEPIEFVKTTVPIELPKTRFEARGLLLLLLQAEGALGSVVDAAAGVFGGRAEPAPLQLEVFKPPYENKDRIKELYDNFARARLAPYELTLEWLGHTWRGFYIEQIAYTRKKGAERGNFNLMLKHVQTVSTATASLPSPAEARLKAAKDLGNRPGSTASADEKAAAAKAGQRSLLSRAFF